MGEAPTTSAMNSQMFRAEVLKGLPKTISSSMENNHDMPGADHQRWCSHVQHHMRRHITETDTHHSKIKVLEEQLLALRLQEAKQQAEQAKKTPKVQAPLVPEPETHSRMTQAPPYIPQPP